MTIEANLAAEALDRAAELLEERGWIQGKNLDDYGQMCAAGAISAATVNSPIQLYYRAYDSITEYVGDNVIIWNDKPGRSEFEVIDALKGCAKAVRNGEL